MTIDVRPPYLFSPEIVEARIAPLPWTSKLIHTKKRSGDQSIAFPRLQKTEREILRILGRADTYEHLGELLRSLEYCLENGWDAHQLGARHRHEFASLMSDLQVAKHCLLRGGVLESPVGLPLEGRKPDLFVALSAGDAIIEVFRPRELPYFHSFSTDVSRLLIEADIRLDYEATIGLDCLSDFSPEGKLVSPMHPIELDEALAMLGDGPLIKVAEQLTSLGPSSAETFEFEWPAVNVKLDCEFVNVRESTMDEPARRVCISGPSYGGYDPVGMFARLMKPIIDKAKKSQAGEPGDHTRVLVCDVSDTVVAVHLRDEARVDAYVEILERELRPRVERDYDVIALCQRRAWGLELQLEYSVCADDKYHSTFEALFGSTRILRSMP